MDRARLESGDGIFLVGIVPNRRSLTTTENSSLHSFFIPKDSKVDIRKELFLLGVDTFSIYGDLESLSERLKVAYGIST